MLDKQAILNYWFFSGLFLIVSYGAKMNVPYKIVVRYSQMNQISFQESEKVFSKLVGFLEDVSRSKEVKIPTKLVDSAWHEFILHTKEYAEYCTQNFGKFIHHVPFEKNTPISKSDLSDVIAADCGGPAGCSGGDCGSGSRFIQKSA